MNNLSYIVSFLMLVLSQALFINGWKATLEKDMIFHDFYLFVSKLMGPSWSKPFVGCVKCMSSVGAAITFWPLVIWVYDFRAEEILFFIADAFVLLPVTWMIYKKQ